jgi:hypothetical protein
MDFGEHFSKLYMGCCKCGSHSSTKHHYMDFDERFSKFIWAAEKVVGAVV